MKKLILFFLLSLFIIFLSATKTLATQNKSLPVLINQIMIGQNEGAKNEFIGLYNPNDFPVDLTGYALKKKSTSGSEANLISNKAFSGIIGAKSFFLISSPEFGHQIFSDLNYSTSNSLSKNNTVILYTDDKEISDKLGYGEVSDFYSQPAVLPENNQILKRNNIELANPNNSFDFIIEKENIVIHNSRSNTINIKNYQEKIIGTETKKSSIKAIKIPQMSDLKNYKNLENGDLLIIEGIVSALPGTLGSQYFYIHLNYENDKNIYGLQVYNYNKKFPNLKTGDRIRVNGELIINKDGNIKNHKIKTKEIEDIIILSSGNKINLGEIEKIINFKNGDLGNVKKVQGIITQNKTNQIYLDDDDEILIEIKKASGISSKTLREGQEFIISGILGHSSGKLKLSLVSEEGIEPVGQNQEKPLGEVLSDEFWQLQSKNQNRSLLKYLVIITIISVLYFIFHRKIIKN